MCMISLFGFWPAVSHGMLELRLTARQGFHGFLHRRHTLRFPGVSPSPSHNTARLEGVSRPPSQRELKGAVPAAPPVVSPTNYVLYGSIG